MRYTAPFDGPDGVRVLPADVLPPGESTTTAVISVDTDTDGCGDADAEPPVVCGVLVSEGVDGAPPLFGRPLAAAT
jgi:hypothetical protein